MLRQSPALTATALIGSEQFSFAEKKESRYEETIPN
jgi:hypothetical protein